MPKPLGRLRRIQRPVDTQVAAADILNCMQPHIQQALHPTQLAEMERLINLALPSRPTPKIVDLRCEIDLIYSRFFIVLFVGKDRRKAARDQPESRGAAVFNWIAAVVLLVGVNLTFCLSLVLIAYLLKSALGIDLIPGHLRGFGR